MPLAQGLYLELTVTDIRQSTGLQPLADGAPYIVTLTMNLGPNTPPLAIPISMTETQATGLVIGDVARLDWSQDTGTNLAAFAPAVGTHVLPNGK